jgi:HAD superfamily hydrolase (TIGR01509 family)
LKALIFDCDGVLVDTEKDGHRVAFNRAFSKSGLDLKWDVELYGELLEVSGGKERMTRYFETRGWPDAAKDREAFIRKLHALKTELFMEIIGSGDLPLRPGVKRLVDDAIAAGMQLAVCTTSNERSVNAVLDSLLGAERKARFAAVLAGDVVSRKKPDPEIYNLAKETLGLPGGECVVIEDSRIGLLAAKGAGMRCVVTMSTYTRGEDFREADRVVSELGDPPDACVTMGDLGAIA